MPEAPKTLVELLAVEPLEGDVDRGDSGGGAERRRGGGLLTAQALGAAGRTVETDRHVHSLHGYFLRPADAKVPIAYEVARARDGRSFSVRQVVAVQDGEAVFSLVASFQVEEVGLEHGRPMPGVPEPESVPRRDHLPADLPFDVRRVAEPASPTPGGSHVAATQRFWIKAHGDLPDDPLLHACAATYLSDLALLDAVLLPHRLGWADPRVKATSLDHAMWFHRPFRADEWLLYDQHSPSAARGRGLALGYLYRRDGAHVASVAQECVVRLVSGATRSPREDPRPG